MTGNGWQPFMLHSVLIPNIGYALPCQEAVDAVKAALAGHPTGQVIEIGAGLGYLSAVFERCGVEVTASDISINPNLRHASMLQMDAAAAMEAYPDRAVLMSWPEPSKANRSSPGVTFGQLNAGAGGSGLEHASDARRLRLERGRLQLRTPFSCRYDGTGQVEARKPALLHSWRREVPLEQ
jgi:hypothetical protein